MFSCYIHDSVVLILFPDTLLNFQKQSGHETNLVPALKYIFAIQFKSWKYTTLNHSYDYTFCYTTDLPLSHSAWASSTTYLGMVLNAAFFTNILFRCEMWWLLKKPGSQGKVVSWGFWSQINCPCLCQQLSTRCLQFRYGWSPCPSLTRLCDLYFFTLLSTSFPLKPSW